jgi:hypothetical protein
VIEDEGTTEVAVEETVRDPFDHPGPWHITVKEPDAPKSAARRFVFETRDEAWACYEEAVRFGFDVQADPVVRNKSPRRYEDGTT